MPTPTTPTEAAVTDFKALQGGNLSVLVELYARTVAWHQQYRELTENAIQAITEGPRKGTVTWRAAPDLLPRVRKLACIDDGHGMTGPQMVRFMNTLAESGRKHGVGANHGIGAKITALAANRAGVEVRSWVDGHGTRVVLTIDGIRRMRAGLDPDCYFEPLDGDTLKPKEIGSHGTMVILLGNKPDEDTTRMPDKAKGYSQTRWLPKYLNGKYVRLPEGVTLTATEKDGTMRRVHGAHHWLAKVSLDSGTVDCDGAVVHWWLLNEKPKNDGTNRTRCGANRAGVASYAIVDSQVAVLHGSESYGLRVGSDGRALLREAGIIHGASRVALHVAPSGRLWLPNPERTMLFNGDGQAFDPRPALNQFAENLPETLSKFIEAEAEKDAVQYDPSKNIAQQLDRYADLLHAIAAARPVRRSRADSEHDPQDDGPVLLLDGGDEHVPGSGETGQAHPDQGGHTKPGSETRNGRQGGRRARRTSGIPTKDVVTVPSRPTIVATDDPDYKTLAAYDNVSNEIMFNVGAEPYLRVLDGVVAQFARDDTGANTPTRRQAIRTASGQAVFGALTVALSERVVNAPGIAQALGWSADQLAVQLSEESLSAIDITSHMPKIMREIRLSVAA